MCKSLAKKLRVIDGTLELKIRSVIKTAFINAKILKIWVQFGEGR